MGITHPESFVDETIETEPTDLIEKILEDMVDDVMTDLTPQGANETSEKAIVGTSFRDIVASVMNEAQFSILNGRTPKHLIKHRPGKGGKTFSYVPHGYVTAKLNQAFGFDWDFVILENGKGERFQVMDEMETLNSRGGKSITPKSIIVSGRLKVRIRDPKDLRVVIAEISKDSTGEKEFVPGMSWGGMIKSAESDAFKKAASRLGVALDLYWQDTDDDYVDPAEKKLKEQVLALLKQGKSKPQVAVELGITVTKVISLSKENGSG